MRFFLPCLGIKDNTLSSVFLRFYKPAGRGHCRHGNVQKNRADISDSSEAADGNRTRVTHLGKVVRNHYATAACFFFSACERRDSNPHTEVLDPKSSVYTNFTTLAC